MRVKASRHLKCTVYVDSSGWLWALTVLLQVKYLRPLENQKKDQVRICKNPTPKSLSPTPTTANGWDQTSGPYRSCLCRTGQATKCAVRSLIYFLTHILENLEKPNASFKLEKALLRKNCITLFYSLSKFKVNRIFPLSRWITLRWAARNLRRGERQT